MQLKFISDHKKTDLKKSDTDGLDGGFNLSVDVENISQKYKSNEYEYEIGKFIFLIITFAINRCPYQKWHNP
tara:strand:+ start:511 stop:726 length:216 start_codon:yes stop_codon:yes gene_type:complete